MRIIELPHVLYPVGHKFTPRGKNRPEYTITGYLYTKDQDDNLVDFRYRTTHEICGQLVKSTDIVHTTIKMADPEFIRI